jgi:protein-tyrosine phosphatase
MIFFNRQKSSADFSVFKADMHSHLIPGIDDGSPDVQTSQQLIRGLKELGFSELITTPHILSTMYPNTSYTISAGERILREQIPDDVSSCNLRSAAEYFLDDLFLEKFQQGEPLLTVSGKEVLCELSLGFPAKGVREILFEIQLQGYTPIIAHPERYIYLDRNKEFFEDLKDMGCRFQLNLLALTPYYGHTVSKLAGYLIKKGHYNYIGTDLHNMAQLQLLRDPEINGGLKKLADYCEIRNNQL